jgi:hypothetical protein
VFSERMSEAVSPKPEEVTLRVPVSGSVPSAEISSVLDMPSNAAGQARSKICARETTTKRNLGRNEA